MHLQRGLTCPVIVPEQIDWARDYSTISLNQLVSLTPQALSAVDPVAMNLIVATGIPSLANLDIRRYQNIVNEWTTDFAERCLPQWEPYFHQAPHDFENDIRFFRLGMVSQYLEQEAGIQYIDDQRENTRILYTNPSDLFTNGVIDTHRGTCGNMATLHVAIGWRLGWPVSLACVNSHYILRFDDGRVTYNIETTQAGHGGFKSDPDEYLIRTKKIPEIALACGSELRAMRPHEMLGAFVGLRARHLQDLAKSHHHQPDLLATEHDWLLARFLFPTNRAIYKNHMSLATMQGSALFEPDEVGHPNSYGDLVANLTRTGFMHNEVEFDIPDPMSTTVTSNLVDELFSVTED